MHKTFASSRHAALKWFSRMLLLAVVAGLWTGSTVLAQSLPVARLYSIFPAGGKQGSTFDVTIAGADLEGVSKLHFSDPAITAVQKTVPPGLGQAGPQGVPGQFTVTIAPAAQLGIVEVRAIGQYGVSNPRAMVVGVQDELVEKEPNNTREQATELPINAVVNGLSNGTNDEDYYKFSATKGQRLIIDCWAYRIDSRIDATLVLYDANGKELAQPRRQSPRSHDRLHCARRRRVLRRVARLSLCRQRRVLLSAERQLRPALGIRVSTGRSAGLEREVHALWPQPAGRTTHRTAGCRWQAIGIAGSRNRAAGGRHCAAT